MVSDRLGPKEGEHQEISTVEPTQHLQDHLEDRMAQLEVASMSSAKPVSGTGPTSGGTQPGHDDAGHKTASSSLDAHELRVQEFLREWKEVVRTQPSRTVHDFYYFPHPSRDAEFAGMDAVKRQAILAGERVAQKQAVAANAQNGLICLPAELRNYIYELVAYQQIREWDAKATAVKVGRRQGVLIKLPLHSNLLGICHRIRLDCKALIDSLMCVEILPCDYEFTRNPRNKHIVPKWLTLQPDEIKELVNMHRWWTYVERHDVEAAKSRCFNIDGRVCGGGTMLTGVMYFPRLPEVDARDFAVFGHEAASAFLRRVSPDAPDAM